MKLKYKNVVAILCCVATIPVVPYKNLIKIQQLNTYAESSTDDMHTDDTDAESSTNDEYTESTYGDYKYNLYKDYIEITKCNANEAHISIPSEIEGVPVKVIGRNAFRYNNKIESIEMPDTVTRIEYGAFYSNKKISTIKLSNSLEYIGDYAFYGCAELLSIDMPDSVTEIGVNVFSQCKKLTTAKLSSGLKSIKEGIFKSCTNLEYVELQEGITTIENNAFSDCRALNNINIPNGVKTIDSYAFNYCSFLSNLSIPESVEFIGDSVFSSTPWLENKIYEDPIVIVNNILINAYYAECDENKVFKIPNNVKGITGGAFSIPILYPENIPIVEDKNIVEIPESVDYISSFAFEVSYISEIRVSNENNTYASIDGVLFDKSIENLICYPEYRSSEQYIIPDTVTEISYSAFVNSKYLQEVILPDNLNTISDRAFYGCKSLNGINIPNSVVYIGNSAFRDCKNMEYANINNDISNSGEYIFANNKNLKNVSITEGITTLPNFIFYECTSLENIELPSTLVEIKKHAFYNTGLKAVYLPSEIKSIGSGAFYKTNIETINLPEGLESIDSSAFSECPNLLEITIPSTVNAIKDPLEGCKSLVSVTILNPECKISYDGRAISSNSKYSENGTILTDITDDFNGTIYGYSNSTAQSYAEKYNKKFISLGDVVKPEPEILKPGDINGDNLIDAVDATYILSEYALVSTGKDYTFSEEQIKSADLNKDGYIDAVDATCILVYYANISTGHDVTMEDVVAGRV